MSAAPSLILFNGKITTLDRQNPETAALAIADGRIVAAGADQEIMALAGPDTNRIDLLGRRVIPGLIASHTHIIPGGLSFNLVLLWYGVRLLAAALRILKATFGNDAGRIRVC